MHFPQTVVPKFILNTENLNQRVNKFKLMVIRQNDYSCYVLCLHRQMASSIFNPFIHIYKSQKFQIISQKDMLKTSSEDNTSVLNFKSVC